MREDAARRAEAQDTQRAREYQAQLEQERATARAQLRPVNEPVWWDRANANDIASAYETASAWQGEDPTIADAAVKMRDELRERYGIDTDNIGADPAQVAEALRQREAQLDLAADSHDDAQQDRHEASSLVRDAEHTTGRRRTRAMPNAASTRSASEAPRMRTAPTLITSGTAPNDATPTHRISLQQALRRKLFRRSTALTSRTPGTLELPYRPRARPQRHGRHHRESRVPSVTVATGPASRSVGW